MGESSNMPGKLLFFGFIDEGSHLKSGQRIFIEEFNILQGV
jgi:hypothetical protein